MPVTEWEGGTLRGFLKTLNGNFSIHLRVTLWVSVMPHTEPLSICHVESLLLRLVWQHEEGDLRGTTVMRTETVPP